MVDLFGQPCDVVTRPVKTFKDCNVPEKKNNEKFNFVGSVLPQNVKPVTCNGISVTPFHIVAFNYNCNSIRSTAQINRSSLNLINNKKKVDISDKAHKRLTKTVGMFIYSARKKLLTRNGSKCDTVLKMITLTLSDKQKHNDIFIKDNLLDEFLDWCRYKHNLKDYVWKAERQSKNTGNIHFHILVNRYIPYLELQNKWNEIQAKYGYLQAFLKKFKHSDPHSTEIRNGKKAKSLISYISKYFSKKVDGDQVLPIEGKTWFCSKSLQGIGSLVLNEVDHNFTAELSGLLDFYSNCKTLILDHCTVYCIDFMKFEKDKNFLFFDGLLRNHVLKKLVT